MMPTGKLLRKWVWQDIQSDLGVMLSNKSFSSPLIFWYMSQSRFVTGKGKGGGGPQKGLHGKTPKRKWQQWDLG